MLRGDCERAERRERIAGLRKDGAFDGVSGDDDFASFKGNTLAIGEPYAHPVALLKPNAFGRYDTHGNVWEWCRDYYDSEYYRKVADPAVDPENTQPAAERVLRGGSTPAGRRNARIGFRVILIGVDSR